jgi:hypothetical protein
MSPSGGSQVSTRLRGFSAWGRYEDLEALAPTGDVIGASGIERLRTARTYTTLLELTWVVSELTPNDDEVVASVLHMLRSQDNRDGTFRRGNPGRQAPSLEGGKGSR